MSGLLEGKHLLITGVINHESIAFAVAKLAQEQGAHIVLTGHGRLHMVEHTASRLPRPPPVIELDVTQSEQLATLAERVRVHLPRLDGILHSIAFAPRTAFGGGDFLSTPWADVSTTLQVSTYSLQALVAALLPLMDKGGSVVGLDFDASVTWPGYDWMGVAKAGLGSSARYLARYLGSRGIRVNLIAAGPLRTVASHGGPAFPDIVAAWKARAPLGWDSTDADGVARTCVALLSDWFPLTTGEILHADGGFHTVGV
jgi:enoyl-[acyl-carrier-protein] reductase (NADH)